MIARILLLAVLLIFPAVADAATCNSSGNFDWDVVTGGTWTGGGCGPVATDQFVITSGSTVTITGDITLGAGGSITVAAGGTLIGSVFNKAGGAGTMTLTLDAAALTCQANSTCTFIGGYRQFGSATPAVLTEPSTTDYFFLPETIIPCLGIEVAAGEPDCNAARATPGDPSLITLRYTDAIENVADGHPGDFNFLESIRDLEATDVICFFDPDRISDNYASHDDMFCYELDAVPGGAATTPYDVVVDIHQGTRNTNGYPLVRREIAQGLLEASIAAGSREACVSSTAPLDIDAALTGRWIRFLADNSAESACDGDGDATVCSVARHSYRIQTTIEDLTDTVCGAGYDRIRIGDVRGFPEARAAGEPVWIDYGWTPGDPVFFMVPFRITSGTAADADSRLEIAGTLSLQAVVLDDAARLSMFNGTLTQLKDVWIKDPTDSGVGSNPVIDLTNTTLIGDWNHVLVTGGNDQSDCGGGAEGCDQMHCIRLSNTTGALNVYDLAFRHAEDDYFYGSGSVDPVTVNRARLQFRGLTTDGEGTSSMQFWDAGAFGAGVFTSNDIECVDCISAPGGSHWMNTETVFPQSRHLLWAFDGQMQSTGIQFYDLTAIGVYQPDGGGTTQYAVPNRMDRCSIRDVNFTSTASFLLAGHESSVKNCIFDNIITNYAGVGSRQLIQFDDRTKNLDIENTIFIDAGNTSCIAGQCTFFYIQDPLTTGSFRLSRNTWTQRPGHSSLVDKWIDGDGSNLTGFVFEGLLFANLRQGTGTGYPWDLSAANNGQATISNICDYDNGQFALDENSLPADTVRGKAPGFINTAQRRYDTFKGGPAGLAPCGIKTGAAGPGIKRHLLYHSWSGIEAEYMGETGAGAGGGGLLPTGVP